MATRKICETCQFWAYNANDLGDCERIHSGGGKRDIPARIFPTASGAYLETEATFGCMLWTKDRP